MLVQPRYGWRGYLAAVGCVSLGAAARAALTPAIGQTEVPFIFFFPAVTAVAWYGGLGPGLFATLLAVLTADWLFVDPVGSLGIPALSDQVAAVAFVVAAGFIVAAVDAMHRAQARVVQEADDRRLAELALADARDLLSSTLTASDRAQAWLATIVEHSSDAIVTKDLNGIVQSWNASAERLLGYTADEIIGTSITRLIPADRMYEETEIIAHLRAGNPVDRFETVRLAKGGRQIPVSLNVSPIKNREGQVIGASKVLHDITDEIAAREARSAVEHALREADRRKDEFLAILSHELRNPLAPIRMAVTMLRQAGPQQPELQQLRDIIDRQTLQLMRLLDDLLDVSRAGSGKIRLRKDVISLAVAVSGAVETVRPLITAQGHELVVTVPEAPIELEGDLGRLAQVLANLLNNAAKFTNNGGRIELVVERRGHEAVVTIRDNGIGLDAGHLSTIFEMFRQVDQSLEKGHGGLGVGLSLAKSFVELHGGRIEARSDGLGRGSAFLVYLPVRPAVSDARGASPADQATLTPALPRRRILVADDNVDSSFVLATALRAAGHEVETTHDGQTAVELVGSFQPELAILDIGMPKLNGYDAARQIRARADARRPTLVAITGWGQDEDRRRALDAGFDRHLTKPVDLRTIQQLIDDLPQ